MINHVRFGLNSIIVKAHRVDAATKSNLDYEINIGSYFHNVRIVFNKIS
jgi:hypothetical protein